VDYTREPIIETVITPKEGCTLVVRSSKTPSQEEYFVDAIEVVSFGSALFFRSTERPKSFLVPVSDYEVVEVREARMILKHTGQERAAVKIGGGRESSLRQERPESESAEKAQPEEESEESGRGDRKRDRKRPARRRKGRGEREVAPKELTEIGEDGEVIVSSATTSEESVSQAADTGARDQERKLEPTSTLSPEMLASLLAPPSMLISDTMERYRKEFKEACFSDEELESRQKDDERSTVVNNAVAYVEAGLSANQIGGTEIESLKDDDDLWSFSDDPEGNR
jgi:hypothetical protein